MFTSRSLLATLLLSLTCATLAASGPAFAAGSATTPPRASIAAHRHRTETSLAGAHCATKSSVSPSHGARLAARRCQSHTHAKRLKRATKSRARHHRRSSESRPEASSAPEPGIAESAVPSAEQNDAAMIASVLATPCQNTELTPSPENIELIRGAVLCLINRKRAENSESPLQLSPALEQAAEGHCQELIADDYFAHVSPSGETPVDRIRTTGYIPSTTDGYVIGENLAWGTYQLSTPQSIVSAWFASPGHLANILEAQYSETGIGVTAAVPASLAEGAPGATYAQEFGVIIR